MTKIEFLAASLPYGLKHQLTEKGIFNLDMEYPNSRNNCMKIIGTCGEDYDLSDGDWGVGYIDIDEFKPIIRHTDTLTQDCVQADYNNGEPFIPIVELGKLIRNGYWYLDNNGATVADKDLFLFLSYTDVDGYFYCEDLNNGNLVSVNQLQLFQQLIRWHYWPNMPENEEVVYVTNEFNPYK